MQIWYNTFCLLMFSCEFYKKWVSVRERNMKLLLETVTDNYKRTSHLHNYNKNSHVHHALQKISPAWLQQTPTCIISKKNCPHMFDAETFTCINAAETSNRITTAETITCVIATKRSTNIIAAESTNDIIAIGAQNLHNCNRRWHLHNCDRKCQLHTSNWNCHLQNWLQKHSLAEMVPVRDPFSYNKKI